MDEKEKHILFGNLLNGFLQIGISETYPVDVKALKGENVIIIDKSLDTLVAGRIYPIDNNEYRVHSVGGEIVLSYSNIEYFFCVDPSSD